MKNDEISKEDLRKFLKKQPTKSIIEKDEYGQDVRIFITETGRIMMRLCPKRLTERTDEEGYCGYKIAEDYADTDIEFYTKWAIKKLGIIEDLMQEYGFENLKEVKRFFKDYAGKHMRSKTFIDYSKIFYKEGD